MEVDESTCSSATADLREKMLDHLSKNNEAHFKSQQKNEPDLTPDEKRHIAENLLDKNPGCFLSRFGQYLNEKHLDYFSDLAFNDYEVNYYLHDLKKRFTKPVHKSLIRNRRLEALRRLTNEGEYFSDMEMRKRNPIAFEELVGQYLTDEEKQHIQSEGAKNTTSFTGYLLNAIDEQEVMQRLKANAEIEEDTDSDESVCSHKSEGQKMPFWGESSGTNIECVSKNKKNQKSLTDHEKSLLMNEFRSHVYSEFLGGRDDDFDYSKVDSNKDYDDLEMLESDQQDQYFDSETPEIISKGDASSDSSVTFDPPKSLTQKMEEFYCS